MTSFYILFYYLAAGLALASTPLFFLRHRNSDLVAIRNFIILIVSITYLVGMIRQDGVDYSNYFSAFYQDHTEIPDIGFQALMFSFNSLGFPFQVMMLFIAAVTILSLRRAAKYFAISFGLLLMLYFLHLAVVRDFSQLRVGFAVALAILGVTSSGKLKRGVFYLLAGSVHFTSLAFILSYEFCRWAGQLKSRRKQIIVMVSAVSGIFFLGSSVQYLGFLDPRIEIYLSWKDENYGLPVGQFLTLFFQMSILALAYHTRKSWGKDARMQTLVFLQILGIAVFVAFIDVAIFAFRISSVTLSLYPVLLISVLAHLRLRVDGYSIANISASLIWLLVGIILISRSGSIEILKAISL
jgi:hypothetical protein